MFYYQMTDFDKALYDIFLAAMLLFLLTGVLLFIFIKIGSLVLTIFAEVYDKIYVARMNRLIKKKFKNKVDKAGKPYIFHLKEVAKNAPDLETKLVALGHDLIEDTNTTEYEFVYKYKLPHYVWDKIKILTRKDGESYKEYIDRLIESKDETILFVKMEDLKHNMDLSRLKTITEKDIERNKKYGKHPKRITKAYEELKKKKKLEGETRMESYVLSTDVTAYRLELFIPIFSRIIVFSAIVIIIIEIFGFILTYITEFFNKITMVRINKTRDVINYIVKHYPFPDDLTIIRTTQLIYLIDWEMTKRHHKQITDSTWYLNGSNPLSSDISEEINNDENIIINNQVSNFGTIKFILQAKNSKESLNYNSLTNEEIEVINTMIEETKTKTWLDFRTCVTSTKPIIEGIRYNYLNLTSFVE